MTHIMMCTVVAICQYIIDEPSSWNSKSASMATLSSVCVLHLPSSHGRTFSIIPRDRFGSLRHSRCPSYVFVSDLVSACHIVGLHPIHQHLLLAYLNPFSLSLHCNTWFCHIYITAGLKSFCRTPLILLLDILSHFYVVSMFLMRSPRLTRPCASSPDNYLSDNTFLVSSNHNRFSLPLLLLSATPVTVTLFPT